MRHRNKPVEVAVPQPHLDANVFEREAPRAHREHVVLKPALGAILEGIAQPDDHLRPQVHRTSCRNIHWVEDGVYLPQKTLGIVEKRDHRLLDVTPVVLGILSQHPERFAVDLWHPGGHVKIRIVVWCRTPEDRHPRHAAGQQSTQAERVRATSRMAKYRTSINAQMVEHLGNVACMFPNGPARLRVGETEPRPVEGDMAETRVVLSCMSDQATSRSAVTVDDDRSRRVGVAPNCVTDMPPISDLQAVGSERSIHPAESRMSPVLA